MKSLVNHLSACAEVALEGKYYRTQDLAELYENPDSYVALQLIIDVVANEIQLTVKAKINDKNAKSEHFVNGQLIKATRAESFEIISPKIWTYNSADMAEACVKFMFAYIIHAASLNDDVDGLALAKHLQHEFKYLLDVDITLF